MSTVRLLQEDLVLAARREENKWVHSEGVYEIFSNARVYRFRPGVVETLVDTDKSVDFTHQNIRSRLCAREYKTKKKGKIQRASPASQILSAVPPQEAVKALVSIMLSVGW